MSINAQKGMKNYTLYGGANFFSSIDKRGFSQGHYVGLGYGKYLTKNISLYSQAQFSLVNIPQNTLIPQKDHVVYGSNNNNPLITQSILSEFSLLETPIGASIDLIKKSARNYVISLNAAYKPSYVLRYKEKVEYQIVTELMEKDLEKINRFINWASVGLSTAYFFNEKNILHLNYQISFAKAQTKNLGLVYGHQVGLKFVIASYK